MALEADEEVADLPPLRVADAPAVPSQLEGRTLDVVPLPEHVALDRVARRRVALPLLARKGLRWSLMRTETFV